MRRLLAILIMFGLVFGQGCAVAGAVCQHHSAREHALALRSYDAQVAAIALSEENAASVFAKKGALPGAGASSFTALADLLPGTPVPLPSPAAQPFLISSGEPRKLIGVSAKPLLQPPHA